MCVHVLLARVKLHAAGVQVSWNVGQLCNQDLLDATPDISTCRRRSQQPVQTSVKSWSGYLFPSVLNT